MAYIPPHRRQLPGIQRQSPASSSETEERLTKSRKWYEKSYSHGRKIKYASKSITRWWLIGLDSDSFTPPVVKQESLRCDLFERENEDKQLPLVFVGSHTENGETVKTFSDQPWVSLSEKLLPDVLTSYQNLMDGIKTPVKPSVVARFGKLLFHGCRPLDMDMLCSCAIVEPPLHSQVKRSFYTNVPTVYMDFVQDNVVPKLQFNFESQKERYRVMVYDKLRPDSVLSCKCIVRECGALEMYKIELNQIRHLVVDISCLVRDIDLRLMLNAHKLYTISSDEEQGIQQLISSAVTDPNAQGGLRWPLGKESFLDRFTVVGVWHTNCRAFRDKTMRLKLRLADRFDFKASSGESTTEVFLKLIRIDRMLNVLFLCTGQGNVAEAILEVLNENLKVIWENFLSCRCSFIVSPRSF